MEFADRQITCIDCGQPFLFTAGEQEFFARKGFHEEPKRCKPCRDQRKARRNNDLMGALPRGNEPPTRQRDASRENEDDFGNRAPSRGPREVRDFGSPRGGRPRELFDAVCAQCGASTRVPFRPVAGRPVYCKECYSGRRGVGA
jgi:CxxC-x17-CxxC domain-containing protein